MDIGTFISNIINSIFNPVIIGIKYVIGFILSNSILTWAVFLLFMGWIGYYIMKVDKEYAKGDKRRVPERTLLLIAFFGGSIGMYIGMYKFKHKTLHKKFTVGVPLIMLIQLACAVYFIVIKIF